MISPYKRILVYDLETGGLSSKYNSITEFAGVAIDLETLEIVEEFSVMFTPYLDLSNRFEEPIKEAKQIFKTIAEKDPETNIKTLQYNNKSITLKSLEVLIYSIADFYNAYLSVESDFISGKNLEELLKDEDFSEIGKIYFDFNYNPQALEVTHIQKELLYKEGVEFSEGFNQIKDLIQRHTVGNSKPIIAGHNINKFDNPFIDKLFEQNKDDFRKYINPLTIDTLEWARLKWFEMSSFSLGVVSNEVGLTLSEAHRALPDTIANAKFLIKMLKNLRGEGGQESKYVRKKYNFNF